MPSKTCFSSRPDIFSRGTLELTFQLLRKNNVSLALDIQNQMQSARMPELVDPAPVGRDARDHFRITLQPQTIGKIVDALTRLGERCLEKQPRDRGQLIVIRTLIEDWIALAEWHISHVQPDSDTLH